ncbi:hypothetical protein AMS68_000368 [Peltaster fructicola]|uniref:Uncharacterized protein n=1 Tax=Peltaster fructicola TaxID=286661 RepID=A0A6H0XJN2_9PEZI|nr:hypothetical protein AMS68_000368 [Peltaster fructicola]
MAPDINTLSPRSLADDQHRARSSQMGPPAAPASTHTTNLPLRHPRPLTAAELYLECEKEQEAVVNRLTRELTALRAQSVSVASNASQSSTSSSLLPVDITDPNPVHQVVGATHPTPSRRHRSSSSLSGRSITTPATTASGMSTSYTSGMQTGVSQASMARAAAASGSRRPSMSASGASTPARRSVDLSRGQGSYTSRPSLSRDVSQNAVLTTAGSTHADTATYRSEMESVKAENEALRQRVRALERALRARRRDSSQSDVARSELGNQGMRPRDAISPPGSGMMGLSSAGVAAWAAGSGIGGVAGPRERSESQSTTASSRRGIPVDEEVKVGESASSIPPRGV